MVKTLQLESYFLIRAIHDINVRFVKVKLKNGIIKTLLTYLPKEIATTEKLKQLYCNKWKIEINYNILKNKLQIEKFSGKKENNHQTRLLQPQILIQYTNSIQTRCITTKNKKNQRKQQNINTNTNPIPTHSLETSKKK